MEKIKYTSIEGKNVVITGASGGIGEALTTMYADNGANLILTDISSQLQKGNYPDNAKLIAGDLSDLDSVVDLAKSILSEVNNVDILINNAGLQIVSPVDQFPDKDWLRLIQVMLVAPFQLTKYFLPGMKKNQWGRIINIASVAGKTGFKYGGAYCASKHGLIGLTKTIALEVAQHGITVNAICPGPIDTTMLRNRLKFELSGSSSTMAILEKGSNAIGRFIQPEEVANLVYYLSLEKSGAITGEALNISGGIRL